MDRAGNKKKNKRIKKKVNIKKSKGRENLVKPESTKAYILISFCLIFFTLIFSTYKNYTYAADMRGLPTQTRFHTGEPYYQGGDFSGLNTNPTQRILENFNNYGVGNIKTKKIYHGGTANRAVYCLDIETEFPGSSPELYNYRGNLMDGNFHIPQIVNGQEQFIYVDANMRGQLRWLFDQFYIRENQGQDIKQAVKRNLFDSVARYELIQAGNANPTLEQIHNKVNSMKLYTMLSDSDIEVVQQWAVWSIVNKDNAPAFNGGFPSKTETIGSMSTAGSTELQYMPLRINLHKYLVETAKTKDANYKNEEVTPIVDLNNVKTQSFVSGNYAFAMYDYSIKLPNNDLNNSNNKSIITEIEILDKNGNIIPRNNYDIGVYSSSANINFNNVLPKDRNLWDVVGQEKFFIAFPTGSPYASDNSTITLKVKYRNIRTYPFVYVPDNRATQNPMQSVVMLDRDSNSKEFQSTVQVPDGYDVALRKSIKSINGEINFPSRLPKIDASKVKLSESGITSLTQEESTAKYMHPKNPLKVRPGDRIIYEINLYNEDKLDKAVLEVRDLLPKNLKMLPLNLSQVNTKYNWKTLENGRIVYTVLNETTGLLKGATAKTGGGININGNIKLELECYVTADVVHGEILTNIAEITKDTPQGKDRDSVVNSIPLSSTKYTDSQLESYMGNNPSNKDLSDPNYYFKGQQDDDDFEKLIVHIPKVDFALKKYIVEIKTNEGNIKEFKGELSREPVVDITPLKQGSTNAKYTKAFDLPLVYPGDEVKYTIRIYNEGETAGFADKVKDNIPNGLEFLPNNEINKKYRWKMEGQELTTDYLSFEQQNLTNRVNLLKPFTETSTSLDYKDLEIVFRVKENATNIVLKNIAEIAEDKDEKGLPIEDIDSTPNNNIFEEDDIDFENLKLVELDLNLKKFITKIGEKEILDRIPKIDIIPLKNKTSTNANYELSKEPLLVNFGQEIEYTIRIYNEGSASAYIEEVKDNIPEDMEFVINHPINKKYKWEMYDSSGNKTNSLIEAKELRTRYLSKEESEKRNQNSLLKGFNTETGELIYTDLKIVFKVKPSNTAKNLKLKNIAEITEHMDEEGRKPKDRDSTPDNDIPEEDDIDYEEVYVKIFDLSLRKYIEKINGVEPKEKREPAVDIEELKTGVKTTAKYNHTKEPLLVKEGDIVEYVIRIYNEGEEAGFAKEVKDSIPKHLEYLPNNENNKKYMWIMFDSNGNTTTDPLNASEIRTKYLENDEIPGFEGDVLHYRDLKVAFKVKNNLPSKDFDLKNIAEITKDQDKENDGIKDRDSTPDNDVPEEDDIDYEDLLIEKKEFDFSLRKFISKINNLELKKSREPKVDITELKEGKSTTAKYDHPKDVVPVPIGAEVEFTIRVYNEGKIAGYVEEITDYLKTFNDLIFLKEHETNIKYGWQVYTKEGKLATEKDIQNNSNLVFKTKYLSREESQKRGEDNLIKPYIEGNTLDYKDIKIVFKIGGSPISAMGIPRVNVAEISEDWNTENIPDKDSTPGNNKEDEDDIDITLA